MLYKEAARIIQLVENKQGSAKNLTLSSTYANKRQLVAIVHETLKYSHVLQQILDSSDLQSLEKSLKDVHLTKVLVYDALFGFGVQGNGKPEKAVKKHSDRLQAELDRIKAKLNAKSNRDLLFSNQSLLLPRFVRVNTLKSSVADVVQHLHKDGYHQVFVSGTSFEQFQNQIRSLKPHEFISDIHIPELLVFSAGTDLHQHQLCTSGNVMLQDKASCFPAVVLNPSCGSHVIDSCAAPGNKTTFLAALMKNEGKIFAFDRDASRFSTLCAMLKKTAAHCVSATCKDFLHVDPLDPKYTNVEYILVDPSCSGSGMVDRIGEVAMDSASLDRRLTSLSNFQAMLLRHALSFPFVRRVVYSTCSVHERENELVVHDVLQLMSNEFQLVDILPTFPGRGESSTLSHAERCVRMTPETSLTCGFFVACLERINKALPDQYPSSLDASEFGVRNSEDATVSVAAISEVRTESDTGREGRKSRKRKNLHKKVPFSSNSEFRAQNAEDATVCILTTGEMESESGPLRERRKSRKRKKSKKEKSTKVEHCELDASLVNEELYSELDGLSPKNQRESLSSVSEATTGAVDTEAVGVIKKSHRRKKLKREKAAKLAKLSYSKLDSAARLASLDLHQSLSDQLPAIAATQTEQVAVGDVIKSHRRKKSKKEKAKIDN